MRTRIQDVLGVLRTGGLRYDDIAKDASGLAAGTFKGYNNSGSSITSGAVVPMPSEDYDVSGWFDPSTGRYTPQVRGIYEFKAQVQLLAMGSTGAPQWLQLALSRNGATHSWGGVFWDFGVGGAATVTAQAIANGTTDYFTPLLSHNHGSAMSLLSGSGNIMNYFEGYMIGRVS